MNVSGGKWIMIVEDDPRVRELAEFAAKKSGAFSTVTLATNGAEAVRRLWTPPRRGESGELPDAVLTDLSMPSMDGLQLARALQAHPATQRVPLFMFSSSGRPNDRESALAVGCRQFFEKPVSVDSLVDIMQAIAEALPAFARP
jgi:CheY-like chemotaxis protein